MTDLSIHLWRIWVEAILQLEALVYGSCQCYTSLRGPRHGSLRETHVDVVSVAQQFISEALHSSSNGGALQAENGVNRVRNAGGPCLGKLGMLA